MDSIIPYCTVLLESFTMITSEELIKIISVMNTTTCSSDPFPSKLLMSHLPTIIDTITHMIILCISTSVFPSTCKSAIVLPLIKKPGLDAQVLKNYRSVSNLSFLSKVIEKVISSLILTHNADNDLIDNSSLQIGVVTAPKLFCYGFIVILLPWLERETGHILFY